MAMPAAAGSMSNATQPRSVRIVPHDGGGRGIPPSPYPLLDPQPAAACLMPAGPKEPCVALDDAAAPQLLSAVRAAAMPMHVAAP